MHRLRALSSTGSTGRPRHIDAAAGGGGTTGSAWRLKRMVKWKVFPQPAVLSTQRRPPISPTRRLSTKQSIRLVGAELLGEGWQVIMFYSAYDTASRLDLRRFYAPYEDETRGAPPFDPAMMVCLLLYAYCVGVFSSRKSALACERNLAFVAIVGSERPDFRTISDFRKLHLEACIDVFVAVVRLAGEAGLVKLGNVSTDGTKIQGHASRHKAMSYGYMKREAERLREDIESLVTQAQQQDESDDAALGSRRGDELPSELKRREDRLTRIASAMRRVEAQAKAEAEAERTRRTEAEAERIRAGKPRRGKGPKQVEESPSDKAQSNFTDPELHIMPTTNKGWEYCGNAQARVDETCQIIVACDVTDASNDKQQAEPMGQ